MRSRAHLVAAVAAAFVLQAVLCPALCFAGSPGADAHSQEHAGAPEKAPCHETSDTPSSDGPREGCDGDCSRFERAVLTDSGARLALDSPAAAFAAVRLAPLAPIVAISVVGVEPLPPPPRSLLLVKNSLLI